MKTGEIGDYLSYDELAAAKIRFAVKNTLAEWQWTGVINRILLPLEVSRDPRIELPFCVNLDSESGKLVLVNAVRARQLIEAVL